MFYPQNMNITHTIIIMHYMLIYPKLAKMKIDDFEKKWRQENNIEIIYPIENTNKQDLDKNIKYRNNFF